MYYIISQLYHIILSDYILLHILYSYFVQIDIKLIYICIIFFCNFIDVNYVTFVYL